MQKRNILFTAITLSLIAALSAGAGALLSYTGRQTSAVSDSLISSSQEAEGGTVNSSDENETLYTLSGQTVHPDDADVVLFPERGLGIKYPKSWTDHRDCLADLLDEDGYCVDMTRPSLIQELSQMTEEELDTYDVTKSLDAMIPLMKIMWTDSSATEETLRKSYSDRYDTIEKLVSTGEKQCFLLTNSSDVLKDRADWTEEDRALFQELKNEIGQIKDWLVLFPVVEEQQSVVDSTAMQQFSGKTADGKDMDASAFENYDLTMVNVWTTWCSSCVAEMPELESLYHNLPDNVNFISVCLDGDESAEAMNKVLEKNKAEFPTVIGNNTLRDKVFKDVIAYPTTFFVDRNGNVVGDLVEGAYSESDYQNEISTRLNSLPKTQNSGTDAAS